jgi:hypothetical protein
MGLGVNTFDADPQFLTLFESYVIALDQRQEICSETNLILGKSLSVFHNVVQSSDLKIL